MTGHQEQAGARRAVKQGLTPRRKRAKRYTTDDEYAAAAIRFLRAWGHRLAQADPEDLARIVELRSVVDEIEQAAIDGLRRIGVSWTEVGAAYGITRQAAQQRWGHR